ncbi:MAG: hypothetical protein ACK4I0_03565 [Brevundimonas sp.]|uniref:hypothetical protein n=1 Tax=Brevundimonas sp. TaxID=1871086 RepID=UPI00391BB336
MRLATLTILAALTATGASAQDRTTPEALSALRACRAVDGDAARLACFDQAARALDEGEARGDLVVVDRSEIQDTRRGLFGLDVPNVRLLERFGGQTQVDAIETTLARAYQASRGEWVFELDDGSVWRQVDTERLTARAAPGAAVRIRRAAMGSYFINVADARALRARRDR